MECRETLNGMPALAPSRSKEAQVHAEAVKAILENAKPGDFLTQAEAFDLLEAYGIPSVKPAFAQTPREAAEIASGLGFPVALKVASPGIAHKSDVGGVLLDLRDEDSVKKGFITVNKNAQRAMPEIEILGVYVQRIIPQGQEVIVGAVQDPQFGPLLMFGSGGVEVEGLKDVEFALAPVTRAEAEEMIDNTWAGRKLRGYRNLPAADREAALEVVLSIARLAADFPQLAEIEINPLRVLPQGQGAVAVDVRGRVT
jgi:acetyltransferase